MEWLEGRITKRSLDAAEAPETRAAITELACKADKLDLSSARERILELALQHQHSGSHVKNRQALEFRTFATGCPAGIVGCRKDSPGACTEARWRRDLCRQLSGGIDLRDQHQHQ